ncbi:flagellar biosynthesis protein FlhF [Butyrivibrio sp. WCD3002]|uniref:flagellar biosynthesis protein FlhF n=1 Tax=Butyrivibrio sp. WCD3002 TaxID=1280676 RepID=UPI000423F66F|nr:flagellar biosynthesis protein FlhF [Butyrivibrio sp. WCD3002]
MLVEIGGVTIGGWVVIIKKYVGRTNEDAEKKARAELGKDYYILYSRQIKKHFWSFLTPPQIEITVAMEDDKTAPKPPKSEPVYSNAQEKKRRTSQMLQDNGNSSNADKADENVQIKLIEAIDNLNKSIASRGIPNEADGSGKEIASDIDDKKAKSVEAIGFLRVLYKNLLASEVDEIYINELTNIFERSESKGIDSVDRFLDIVYEKMVIKCGVAEPICLDENMRKLKVFLGPTGVGKTTTIAKLAAELVTSNKKVAMATIDTYRIGATEQLRIYAERMYTPFNVIYSSDELFQTIQLFQEYDYIFLDTAGHNFSNNYLRNRMFSIIEPVLDQIETDIYLVLSSTTSYKELIEIADAYAEYFDYRIIYTKVDEKPILGNLYNLKQHTGSPISYLTYGQTVPGDICVFDPQKLVRTLLGAQSYTADMDIYDNDGHQ